MATERHGSRKTCPSNRENINRSKVLRRFGIFGSQLRNALKESELFDPPEH
jgi:hypothetical protein